MAIASFETTTPTPGDVGVTIVSSASGHRIKVLSVFAQSPTGAVCYLASTTGGRLKFGLSANVPCVLPANPEGWLFAAVGEPLILLSDTEGGAGIHGCVTYCYCK